jgi:AraC-like DNA-binding protein
VKPQFEKIAPPQDRSFLIREIAMRRFDAPWHFHPECELTLILESHGRRFVADSIEMFAPGDLVLLGPNVPHFWHTEGRSRGLARAVFAQFRPDFLGEEALAKPELAAVRGLLRRSARGLVFSGPKAAKAARRLKALPGKPGLEGLLELLGILDTLAPCKFRPLAGSGYIPSLNVDTESRLGRAYAFLTAHFGEPLTLAQIARSAAMTPAAFSRFFKRVSGRNVSVFLNDLRIDHASRLLQDTERGIAEIAFESGFDTLSSFNRQFRARRGSAPSIYRRTFANSAAAQAPG